MKLHTFKWRALQNALTDRYARTLGWQTPYTRDIYDRFETWAKWRERTECPDHDWPVCVY